MTQGDTRFRKVTQSLRTVSTVSTSARLRALALLCLGMSMTAGVAAPVAIAGAYAPRDECAAQSGAAAFRGALADAIGRRDAAALVALADPQVKLDFGEGAGQAELRKRLTGEEGPALWRELAELLPLGCAVDDGNLVLPWFFAQDLAVDDPYGTLLVTGDRVPLLPQADAAAPPLRLLSWALVEPREGYDESAEFQPVRTIDGGVAGFVAAAKLRSPIGYRLIAGRVGKAWKIEAFIAGD